jgi:hypothetical protein
MLMLSLAGSACHSAEPASAPIPAQTPALRAPFAQRCPELFVSRSTDSTITRVFVEIAQLSGNREGLAVSPPQSVPPRPFDPKLELQRVASLLVTNDVTSSLAWDAPAPPSAANAPQSWDLGVTPHFASTASSLQLELDLAPAPPLGTAPENWSIPEHRRVHTTVVLGEQQSIQLRLPPGAGATHTSVMVVTPYFIREDADLRRLFECKLRGRRSASASF